MSKVEKMIGIGLIMTAFLGPVCYILASRIKTADREVDSQPQPVWVQAKITEVHQPILPPGVVLDGV